MHFCRSACWAGKRESSLYPYRLFLSAPVISFFFYLTSGLPFSILGENKIRTTKKDQLILRGLPLLD